MGLESILEIIVFILPAYVANATPVLFGGGTPMDFGKNFSDGKRMLGKGKTWRGFLSGILAGSLAGYLLALQFPFLSLTAGFLLSLGALFGDTIGSFVKRRLGIEPGRQSLALDQLTFLLFALLFVLPAPLLPDFIDPVAIAFLVAFTYVLHVIANVFAHRMGWKKVPW